MGSLSGQIQSCYSVQWLFLNLPTALRCQFRQGGLDGRISLKVPHQASLTVVINFSYRVGGDWEAAIRATLSVIDSEWQKVNLEASIGQNSGYGICPLPSTVNHRQGEPDWEFVPPAPPSLTPTSSVWPARLVVRTWADFILAITGSLSVNCVHSFLNYLNLVQCWWM